MLVTQQFFLRPTFSFYKYMWQSLSGHGALGFVILIRGTLYFEVSATIFCATQGSVCSTEVSWEAVEEQETMPTLWMPDHAVSHCQGCHNQFWLGRRKHHCRYQQSGLKCKKTNVFKSWVGFTPYFKLAKFYLDIFNFKRFLKTCFKK